MAKVQTANVNPSKLTPKQFAEALGMLGARITETDRRLLHAHYHFPNRTASARQLSEAIGWKGEAANLHYGRLAGKFCEVLGKVEHSDNMYMLARFVRSRGKQAGWHWVMRPNLAKALAELKWV